MSLSTKKVLLWIRSPGAMTAADAKKLVPVSCALLWWWSQATSTEWMGNNSFQRKTYLATKSKG